MEIEDVTIAYEVCEPELRMQETPEPYARTPEQVRRMHRSYEKKREWMDQRGLCVWNGEWGPVYARKEYDGDGWEATNERRYNVLNDQLHLYGKVSRAVCRSGDYSR